MMLDPEQAIGVFVFVSTLLAIAFTYQIVHRTVCVLGTLPSRRPGDFFEALRVALLPDDTISTPSSWHF